jgi:pentatricopeptide repeat protein
MLKMMRHRNLKGDPAAYQCLIDACGRCGDTQRATQLLGRMHEDGIVADGVVYSCLVSAFSTETAWRKVSGHVTEDLPEWANGASVEMDWNKLRKSDTTNHKTKIQKMLHLDKMNLSMTIRPEPFHQGMKRIFRVNYNRSNNKSNNNNSSTHNIPLLETAAATPDMDVTDSNTTGGAEAYVTDAVLRQILLGENLLEIVYPDICIDTDNELCPRCNTLLTDDEVVLGWKPNDSQDYTTQCRICSQKFVPHFCVQSSLATAMGSKGPGSPLFCERLSPWVLIKELRSVMGDKQGIENLLSPEWRELETKNAVLWWNLILSFMRYRFPFTFLLQGSFDQNLIQPTPDEDESP